MLMHPELCVHESPDVAQWVAMSAYVLSFMMCIDFDSMLVLTSQVALVRATCAL